MIKAGQITITLDAGTGTFITQIETAKAKLREFGATGEVEHKKVAAAVKALEGGLLNNVRAADAFLDCIKGLGPLINAAFPVLGAVAFAGVLLELGKKVTDFFKTMKEEPEKAAAGWNKLLNPIETTNDELDLSIAKLDQDIAKLQGKRPNNLAIALAEAKVEADHLYDSLEKDLEALNKLMKEQSQGFLQSLFTPGSGTAPLSNVVQDALKNALGGESGLGGFYAQIQKMRDDESKQLQALKNSAGTKAGGQFGISVKIPDDMLKQTAETISDNFDALITAKYQKLVTGITTVLGSTEVTQADTEFLERARRFAQDEISRIAKTQEENKKKAKVSDLTTDEFKPDKLIQDRINVLEKLRDAAKDANAAVGATEAEKAALQAAAEYGKVITELGDKLGKFKHLLAEPNKSGQIPQDVIKGYITETSKIQEDTKSKELFDESTRSLKERIQAQKDLTAAIGATYEQQRAAFAQTQVAEFLKRSPNATPEQQAQVRAQGETLFGERQTTQQTGTLEKIQDQIDLERSLALAQYQGAEAVRQVELAERIRIATRGLDTEAAKKLTQAMKDEYDANRLNAALANTTKYTNQAEASTRVSGAAFNGAEAVRQQKLMNEYIQMAQQGATIDEIAAKAAADWNANQEKINLEAAATVNHYQDALEHLNQMKAAIQEQAKEGANQEQTEIALREIEKERLKLLTDYNLKLQTASAALHAFLENAKAEAKSAGQIIFDSLNSALDKVSDQFAKLMTGQKTSWAKMFQGLGEEIEKATIKASLQKGLGALANKVKDKDAAAAEGDSPTKKGLAGLMDQIFGKKGAGPNDGSAEGKALWVRMAEAKAKDATPKTPGAATDDEGNPVPYGTDSDTATQTGLGGLFGGGAMGTSGIFSLMGGGADAGSTGGTIMSVLSSVLKFLPAMAEGGDVDPYSSYLVGEHAPEVFQPRTSGSIIPLDKLGSSATGGNHYYSYSIDARGAALGTENRIARSIDLAHASAIQKSVQATNERAKRTPQRTKNT